MEITEKKHLDTLAQVLANIETQDSRATAEPIYVVQQRKRIYGIDPMRTEYTTWIDELNGGEELTEEEAAELEAQYLETLDEPESYSRIGYVVQWEFVQPFFTEEAAQQYINANKHNLTDPRIYVNSAYRNKEWQLARALFISMKENA